MVQSDSAAAEHIRARSGAPYIKTTSAIVCLGILSHGRAARAKCVSRCVWRHTCAGVPACSAGASAAAGACDGCPFNSLLAVRPRCACISTRVHRRKNSGCLKHVEQGGSCIPAHSHAWPSRRPLSAWPHREALTKELPSDMLCGLCIGCCGRLLGLSCCLVQSSNSCKPQDMLRV